MVFNYKPSTFLTIYFHFCRENGSPDYHDEKRYDGENEILKGEIGHPNHQTDMSDLQAQFTKKIKGILEGKIVHTILVFTIQPPFSLENTMPPPVKKSMLDLGKGPINMDAGYDCIYKSGSLVPFGK